MSFGGRTVTHVHVAENPAVRDENGQPQLVRTETTIPRCHFRPLNATEIQGLGERVTEAWQLTGPPAEPLQSATSTDELIVDGVTYQFLGPARTYWDAHRPFKVSATLQRTQG